MGNVLSYVIGGSAAAGEQPDYAGIMSFHSEARWQLHQHSINDTSQLMVIDFSASWCGPCKLMEPPLQAMADKYTDVSFVKIDVDELPGVSKEFDVQAMPTFVLMRSGKIIDRIIGARKDELERKIQQYSQLLFQSQNTIDWNCGAF